MCQGRGASNLCTKPAPLRFPLRTSSLLSTGSSSQATGAAAAQGNLKENLGGKNPCCVFSLGRVFSSGLFPTSAPEARAASPDPASSRGVQDHSWSRIWPIPRENLWLSNLCPALRQGVAEPHSLIAPGLRGGGGMDGQAPCHCWHRFSDPRAR